MSGEAPGVLRDAYLVAVGDELLLGRTADTNSQEIARALTARGLSVRGVLVVPDDPAAIARALDATPPGALVSVTGGLGPTPDDLTREALAAWAGAALAEAPALVARLRERCAARGVPYHEGTARQARVPAGLDWLPNPVGSAPGLAGELRGRTLLVMPGVPAEMRALLADALARWEAAGRLPALRPAVLLRTAQVGEGALARLCSPLMAAHPGLAWSWWLVRWGVDVRISLPPGRDDDGALAAAGDALRAALGEALYAEGTRELPDVVREALVARGATLAVAESCTGGGLGAALTSVAGASAVFRGGVIAYADAVKSAQLGVPAATLAAHGAVSGQTALAMAAGCRARFGVDYALAVTGIAGPDGGTADKPVGTVWIAVDARGHGHARRYRFP
ncbi:MAG: nicotinamide-nucleotide amidohydrolase family protein, partial [Candidatus Krumholzibacteriia bacterium]